jgi:hypothetical protein
MGIPDILNDKRFNLFFSFQDYNKLTTPVPSRFQQINMNYLGCTYSSYIAAVGLAAQILSYTDTTAEVTIDEYWSHGEIYDTITGELTGDVN